MGVKCVILAPTTVLIPQEQLFPDAVSQKCEYCQSGKKKVTGGSKMVQVLYVGQYKEGGKITTIQWRYFMEWCKTECNEIIVYSKMPYNTICTKFPLYCNINELQSPDELLDIYAFEINIFNISFWEYIKES